MHYLSYTFIRMMYDVCIIDWDECDTTKIICQALETSIEIYLGFLTLRIDQNDTLEFRSTRLWPILRSRSLRFDATASCASRVTRI